ncbi:MAG: hypothetical protein AAFZ65_02985 [Planctomycetota bacterium]
MNAREDAHEIDAVDGEFADLLGALGAETETDLDEALGEGDDAVAREISLARATIQGLRESLAGLEPLGEELAQSERRRLALEVRVEELEALRHTQNRLLSDVGRLVHAAADGKGPTSRRFLRRLANLMALEHGDCWPVIADLEHHATRPR